MDEWGNMANLRSVAEALADAKKVRVACVNRVEHGDADSDKLRAMALIAGPARDMEERYITALLEEYRAVVPDRVREWAAGIPGFGDGVLFARLIGHLGNPRIATPCWWEGSELIEGEPYDRTVSELWAYAGCGDPSLSACYGYRADSRDKTLALGKRTTVRACLRAWTDWLVRQGSPGKKGHAQSQAAADSQYFKVLMDARSGAEGKVHARQCQNRKPPPLQSNGCGTKAHPGLGAPGSPWRPGHMRAHAHRITHKELLRDLWLVSG